MEADAVAAGDEAAEEDDGNQDEDAEMTDLAEADDAGDLENHPEESFDAEEALLADPSEAVDDSSKVVNHTIDPDTSVQQDSAEPSVLQSTTLVTSTPKVPTGTQPKPANVQIQHLGVCLVRKRRHFYGMNIIIAYKSKSLTLCILLGSFCSITGNRKRVLTFITRLISFFFK